jgi:hypothetical protein
MKQFFILIVGIFLFVPGYLYGQNPEPSAKEIYELREQCESHAATIFKEVFSKNGMSNDKDGVTYKNYKNHYNVKLNKCFVLINTTSYPHSKSNDALIIKVLWDINEVKKYGTMTRLRRQSTPTECSVKDRICKSENEWDSLVKPYMEN